VFRRGASLVIALLVGQAAAAIGQAPEELTEPPSPTPPQVFAPRPLTIGEALRAAFYGNPNLLDSEDLLYAARVNEKGVASTYLPQVTPFFSTLRSQSTGIQAQAYGLTASQQFSFGTLLEGSVLVTHAPFDSTDPTYRSDYIVTLSQPLLRGADPVVTAEPLRLARRTSDSRTRALETQRRRTVILIYQLYLGLAREEQAVSLAIDRMERAQKLTQFSRARFLAGSVSRLDVLRAEQQEASAVVDRNDAQNLAEDLRDQLRRSAGLKPGFAFTIRPPAEIPSPEPPLDRAVYLVGARRLEAAEAREGIHDARLAVRIAKSLQLPSLDGVLSYEGVGVGRTVGDALPARNPALLFGFRSQYGLNSTVQYAQRREAEIDLTTRERNFQLLEEDLVREVQRAYRRLDAQRRNYEIAAENLKVAELQAKVARLRFEKGLSDNFNVVDADNLLNSARLLDLDSRLSILLAQLDCLYASGYLDVASFLQQP
jgi:outer membrane protein TolC